MTNAVLHSKPTYRVAVVKWSSERDGIAEVINYELEQLGHHPFYFKHDATIPGNIDVVFSFAPYGRFLPIPRQLTHMRPEQRPVFVHWNTEGMPDPRLPSSFVLSVSKVRSWIGRFYSDETHLKNWPVLSLLFKWEQNRMLRFRYLGDYYFAYNQGWLNVLADSSAVYIHQYKQLGLPAVYAPWGSTPMWYEDLKHDRDIDILWMGKRGSQRRNRLLNSLRHELEKDNIQFYVADNVENPFIFDEERIHFLNRAKITLNLTRTWYDDNFSRFALAAPNRSLIVSEPLLPHCPYFEAGIHYISAPIEKLADTIRFYLAHKDERQCIVENAYKLITTQLKFRHSIESIMDAVSTVRQNSLVKN